MDTPEAPTSVIPGDGSRQHVCVLEKEGTERWGSGA